MLDELRYLRLGDRLQQTVRVGRIPEQMKGLLQAFKFGQRHHDDSFTILPSYNQRSAAVADTVQVLFRFWRSSVYET